MSGYPWVKLYTDLLDNPRFSQLSDGAKARYCEALLLAGKADAGGLLSFEGEKFSLQDLAYQLRQQVGKLEAELSELCLAGFLEDTNSVYSVTSWNEKQGPAQAEKRAEWNKRQRKRRARVLGIFEEQESDSEKEEELDKEKEVEKRVTRESRVTEEDATTLHLPEKNTPSSGLTPHNELQERVACLIREQGREPNFEAIQFAIQIWTEEWYTKKKDGVDWKLTNIDAILERYDMLMLSNDATIHGQRLSMSETPTYSNHGVEVYG